MNLSCFQAIFVAVTRTLAKITRFLLHCCSTHEASNLVVFLSRAIADVGLYEFRRQIEYKAKCRSLYPVSVTTYVTCKGCCCGRWIDTSMVQSPYMLKDSSLLKTAI